MIVTQAFRYELDPNNVERTLLAKHAGAARFAWNWGLARRIERFEKHEGRAKFTSAVEQHRELNALKQTEYPWMYEVSKCAPQEALRDLDRALRNFWRERKKRNRIGCPKFKKKGVHDAFRLTGAIHVNPCSIGLPRLGEIRTKEDTSKLSGRILSATVSRGSTWDSTASRSCLTGNESRHPSRLRGLSNASRHSRRSIPAG